MTSWVPVEPLGDCAEQRDYWPTFKVGDRVRLAPNAECPYHPSLSFELAGEVGTVVEIVSEDHSHDYHVRIDRVELLPTLWMAEFGPWCARSELEPLP